MQRGGAGAHELAVDGHEHAVDGDVDHDEEPEACAEQRPGERGGQAGTQGRERSRGARVGDVPVERLAHEPGAHRLADELVALQERWADRALDAARRVPEEAREPYQVLIGFGPRDPA